MRELRDEEEERCWRVVVGWRGVDEGAAEVSIADDDDGYTAVAGSRREEEVLEVVEAMEEE